ncbi:FMN-binding negative transcriptional regulator [Colwellia sp. D2M02]|uniref:FMN-binding negative transcriptional regulator n=1 Tax=Colwellia sp. D2M02 TaxID=2841562 RepID=UPI001C09C3F8|nr:FMN-binding negative transcriptional regulator [Colwellia sp. D2M02]MBU2892740.1 FMN-binding negative transcriptional regulator [Colwellia sp. D2M02]
MYPAKHFIIGANRLTHPCKIELPLINLIEQNPLATLIVQQTLSTEVVKSTVTNALTNKPLHISHIPCHFKQIKDQEDHQKNKQLITHVSNQHPLAKMLMANRDSKQNDIDNICVNLVFHGEQGYISPNDLTAQNRGAHKVPTWNYCKVQLTAVATEVADEAQKYHLMSQTSQYFERNSDNPWLITDVPVSAIKQMLKAITFIELTITMIEGNFKLSQNKPNVITKQLAQQLIVKNNAPLAKQMLTQISNNERKT